MPDSTAVTAAFPWQPTLGLIALLALTAGVVIWRWRRRQWKATLATAATSPTETVPDWHALNTDAVFEQVNGREQGLEQPEAERRLVILASSVLFAVEFEKARGRR